MGSIKCTNHSGGEYVRIAHTAHSGFAVSLTADDISDTVEVQLTSKQARAIAGWINSNVPKEDDGIEVTD